MISRSLPWLKPNRLWGSILARDQSEKIDASSTASMSPLILRDPEHCEALGRLHLHFGGSTAARLLQSYDSGISSAYRYFNCSRIHLYRFLLPDITPTAELADGVMQ